MDAPEADGVVYFTSSEPLENGQFLQCGITDVREYDLIGCAKVLATLK